MASRGEGMSKGLQGGGGRGGGGGGGGKRGREWDGKMGRW